MVGHCIRGKVLDGKEVIGIEKFYDSKILVDTDDKFPDDITLKNVVVLITYVLKDDGKSCR